MDSFKAFVVSETDSGFFGAVQEKEISELPQNDLLVKVHYSSLNYKDALSASGNKGVTKEYPHTPGIDAAGVVVESKCDDFQVGDDVIVTSYDLGMNISGGFSEYISVPASWAVKLPEGMTLKESMILGTAGLTAGMSVAQIVGKLDKGKIAVSGSTGGVGSLSIAILAKLGYEVVAITGKKEEEAYLKSLGASEILLRSEFNESSKRPLLKPVFSGAIDTVGGQTLENLIKSTDHMGVVTLCGNIGGADFSTNVYPFILRGLSLVGIESQNFPMADRQVVWESLAKGWKPCVLMDVFKEVTLEGLDQEIKSMLQGKAKGRVLVRLT